MNGTTASTPSTGEPLLTLDGAAVSFATRHHTARALDGVSLTWRSGEVLGIVGESGSGKSTTARAMLGVQPLTEGSLSLGGAVVRGEKDLARLRRTVQMVFQDPYQALNPRHSVEAIVREPLRVHRVPRAEHATRINRALRDVGLEPERFLGRYPHQLSGGQRQRVAIAAALVLEPAGLICDEPLSMLDVSVSAQIVGVLQDLRRGRNLSMLFITHDLALAWSICDRVAVMYLGRIVEIGSAEEVIGHPSHPYTRALVDAVPSTDPGYALPQPLGGDAPDAANVPQGCRFHPRCPYRFEPCDNGPDPALLPTAESSALVACHLFTHDPDRVGVPTNGARR